jgi:hypothetical protein
MPRRKPTPPASRHLRRAIASAAARLMAEDGITDYSMAKRKAARSMGAENGEALPTNEEIQAELRAYQAIYQEDEQAARLHALRQTALNAMQLLNEFQPRLTGAVLDGTAGRYSPVHLQLFADCSKDVEIWLLSNNIVFKSSTLARKSPTGAEDQFVLDMDDTTILLDIFPPKSQHWHPQNQSMAATEVQTLLASPASPPPNSPSDYGIS